MSKQETNDTMFYWQRNSRLKRFDKIRESLFGKVDSGELKLAEAIPLELSLCGAWSCKKHLNRVMIVAAMTILKNRASQ